MDKEKLKNQLERLGYIILIREDHIFGGKRGGESPVPGNFFINGAFSIYFMNKKFKIIMQNAIVGKTAEFDNEKDLIEFIKKESPLK